MDRCNVLCTKDTTGTCAACEAWAEADRFFRFWFKGGWLIDRLRALQQWRHAKKKLVKPEGSVPQQQLWERAERLRGAADEAARLVQNFYVSFLLLGTYIAVIIGSTTDVQLLKSSPVALPLLNVPLPIVGFYVVVPWLLLLLYFNLLLHLTLLAQKLHQLNAVLAAFTDATAREEQRARLFPFPFSTMLIGRPARWFLRMLLGLMVWTTILLLPLLLLLYAQVRFLPYHDTGITCSHRFAVLGYLLLVWGFWPLILMPARHGGAAAQELPLWREEQRQRAAQRITRKMRLWWGLGLFCLTLVTGVFSWGIAVLPEERMEGLMASLVPQSWRHVEPDRASTAVFIPTYWLFEKPGAFFPRNLRLQEQVLVAGEPSAKVIAALRSDDETKRTQALDEVAGLILTNRDLRGADFRRTLFAKGDLRGANLKRANLWEARVFTGNLSPLEISKGERCVETTQLSENGLVCFTHLQGANLSGAQLQGANLQQAQLQGASLSGGQFQEADLRSAQLHGAVLAGAQLQGANLFGAYLQGADLRSAQLQGANLVFAQLQGTDSLSVRLQGANLFGARLQGADLRYAQLQGANLRCAHIGSADFTEAWLTGIDLRELVLEPLEEKTYEALKQTLTDARNYEARRTYVLQRIEQINRVVKQHLDNMRRKDSLRGAETTAVSVRLGNYSASYFEGSAVRQPARLQTARATQHVLCDHPHPLNSCLTQKQIAEYAHDRAMFLGWLGCKNAAIARGMVSWHRLPLVFQQGDPILVAFAKHVAAIPEKDCPGWAALQVDQKDALRERATAETSAETPPTPCWNMILKW